MTPSPEFFMNILQRSGFGKFATYTAEQGAKLRLTFDARWPRSEAEAKFVAGEEEEVGGRPEDLAADLKVQGSMMNPRSTAS